MASRVLLKELQSIERKRTFFFRQLKQHFLFKMTIAFIRKYYLFEATNLKRLDSKLFYSKVSDPRVANVPCEMTCRAPICLYIRTVTELTKSNGNARTLPISRKLIFPSRASNRVYLVKAKYARILEILRDSQIQNERYSALRITDSINTSIRKFRKNVIARDTTSSNSR